MVFGCHCGVDCILVGDTLTRSTNEDAEIITPESRYGFRHFD